MNASHTWTHPRGGSVERRSKPTFPRDPHVAHSTTRISKRCFTSESRYSDRLGNCTYVQIQMFLQEVALQGWSQHYGLARLQDGRR